jgi:hypothetical protein
MLPPKKLGATHFESALHLTDASQPCMGTGIGLSHRRCQSTPRPYGFYNYSTPAIKRLPKSSGGSTSPLASARAKTMPGLRRAGRGLLLEDRARGEKKDEEAEKRNLTNFGVH